MNNDLISRSAAIEIIRSMTINLGGKDIFHPEAKKSVIGVLDEIAAADAEPVRYGRWIKISHKVVCSRCRCERPYKKDKRGYHLAWRSEYCPNCGAGLKE